MGSSNSSQILSRFVIDISSDLSLTPYGVMAVLTSMKIILVVAATTEAAQEILFDPKVTFKPNASSRLLEISFERQELFSVLNQSETYVKTFQCSLRKNG